MARARTMVVAAASALAIAGATGCSSDDSSSDGTVDRSSPSTPEAVSSLTASTHPVGTSTTTGATTSEPSLSTTTTSPRPVPFDDLEIVVYPVPAGSRPHDVAPAADGGVWYTAQRAGALGHLDPVSGRTRHIALGAGSAPHGVIVDDEGIAWVTDGGLNAIVSVDPDGDVVTVFPLPDHCARREPQHGRVRRRRAPVVHGPDRLSRCARPEDRRGPSVRVTARTRPLRHRGDAGRRDLLRLPGRELRRRGCDPMAA